MKIVCDACAAKYSIADEKVAGKVFKIRCKKCSNVIVVRGAAEAEAGAPELEQKETRVFDYSGYDNPQEAVAAAESSIGEGAVWHIVVDQEQVGPLSPEEVRAHFARGEVDGESFIWREGFADWERIDSLAEFADLAAAGNVDDAAAAMFGGPALDDGADADPADLFTAQAAEPMVAVPSPAEAGGLFGGAADDGGLFGGATAEPAMAAAPVDDKLKGQRNENSVLFSLNNLASLASDAPKAAAPVSAAPSSSGGGGGMAQAGGQEGSGLIDIRAMASMYVGNSDQASPGGSARIDDLPVFSQPAIASASPVLMPVAAPANNNKLLVALIAGIGALVLVAVLLVILVLRGGGDDDKPQAAANTNTDKAGQNTNTPAGDGDKSGDGDGDGDTAKAGDGDGDGPAAGKNTAASDAAKAEADRKKAEEKARKEAEREERRKEREERLKNETPAQKRARLKKEKKEKEERKKREEERRAKREAERAKTEAKNDSKKGGCDELDCLVNPNKSCCKKKKSGGSDTKKTDSSLPSRPPKSSLSRGMGKAKGSARACASKANFSGKVSVKVRVSGSGRVSSASAKGGKGSVNSCVASAVKRRARFPKSQDGISFTYSYRL